MQVIHKILCLSILTISVLAEVSHRKFVSHYNFTHEDINSRFQWSDDLSTLTVNDDVEGTNSIVRYGKAIVWKSLGEWMGRQFVAKDGFVHINLNSTMSHQFINFYLGNPLPIPLPDTFSYFSAGFP